jgi:regulator of replication initiation timing
MPTDGKVELSDDIKGYINGCIIAGIDSQKALYANTDSRDKGIYETTYERNMAIIKGKYWRGIRSANKRAPRRAVNLILPKLTAQAGALFVGDTTSILKVRDPEFDEEVYKFEGALNDTWQSGCFDRVAESCWWDSKTYRFGVYRVGWKFERKGVKLEGQRGNPVVPDDAVPIAMNPDGSNMSRQMDEQEYDTEEDAYFAAMEAEKKESQQFYGDPVHDEPYITRIKPIDLIVDPDCKRYDLLDARYVFERKWVPLGELQNDSRLENVDDLEGESYSYNIDDRRDTDVPEMLPEYCRVKIYDGYIRLDLDDDGVFETYHVIVAGDTSAVLLCEDSPYSDEDTGQSIFPNKNPYPFVVIPDVVVDNDCWMPDSVVENAADIQLAYDEAISTLFDIMRRSPRFWIAVEGNLKPEHKAALSNAQDGDVIELPADAFDSIRSLDPPDVPAQIYSTLETCERNITRIIGTDEYTEGVMPAEKRLATEAMMIQQSGGARSGAQAKHWRLFRSTGMGCILGLMQKFQVTPKTFQYTTPDGKDQWGAADLFSLRGWKNEDDAELNGYNCQFLVDIDVDSENPTNPALEKQQLNELLGVLGQFLQMPDPTTGQPMVNIKPILEKLCELNGVRPKSVIAQDNPEDQTAQMQQMIQQLQQQLEEQTQQLQMILQEEEQIATENEQLKQQLEDVGGQIQSLQQEKQDADRESKFKAHETKLVQLSKDLEAKRQDVTATKK